MSTDYAYSSVVGVDVSQGMPCGWSTYKFNGKSYSNDAAGIASLTKQFLHDNPDLVVFEATGGYERALAKSLHLAGIKCIWLIHSVFVSLLMAWATSQKRTHRLWQILVQYGLKKCPEPNAAPDPDVETSTRSAFVLVNS